MAERSDFLDAIRAAPDEDAPRLIYADWLDDQGEGERAALIRFQCAEIADDPVAVRATGDRQARQVPRCDIVALARRIGLDLGSLTADDLLGFRRGFLAGFRYPYNPKLSALRRLLAEEPMEECHITVTGRSLVASVAALGRDIVAQVRCVAVKLYPDFDLQLGELPLCREFRAQGVGRVEVGLPAVARLAIADDSFPIPIGPVAGLGEVTAEELWRLWRACGRRPEHLEIGFGARLGVEDLPTSTGLRSLALRNVPVEALPRALIRYEGCPLESLTLRLAARPWDGPEPDFARIVADLPARPPADLRALRFEPSPTHGGEIQQALIATAHRLEVLRSDHRPIPEGVTDLDVRAIPYSIGAERSPIRLPPRLTRLRVRDAFAEDLPCLAATEALAGLEALRVDGTTGDSPRKLTADHVAALANSAFGPDLRALTLGRVSDVKVRAAAIDLFGSRCDVYWQTGAET